MPAQESLCAAVAVRVPDLHHVVGLSQWSKPELFIQSVRVARHEQKHTQILQVRMIEDRPHQCLGDPTSSIFREDEHVHQIREYRPIGDHSSERHLSSIQVDAEAQGILNRTLDDRSPASPSPIRCAQEAMNQVDVKACDIRGDLELRRHCPQIRDAAPRQFVPVAPMR